MGKSAKGKDTDSILSGFWKEENNFFGCKGFDSRNGMEKALVGELVEGKPF